MPKRYVLVNIPAAQIEAVESDDSRVAPRRRRRQTRSADADPEFGHHGSQLQPAVDLPPTVIEKDLIPKGREMQTASQNVLVKFDIDAYGGDGKKLDPEQDQLVVGTAEGADRTSSGRQADNPLGFVKINFDNAHSVYMHDTPSEIAVRAQFPRGKLGLRAGAGHRAPGGLGAGRQGLEAGARRRR